jgi:hypothetical protein
MKAASKRGALHVNCDRGSLLLIASEIKLPFDLAYRLFTSQSI